MKDVPRWLAESVLQPDEKSDELDLTLPNLRILEPASLDTVESVGFDPYDTGVLQKK